MKTFYGGKYKIGNGVDADTEADIICFDNSGKIRCSGKKTEMLKLAIRNDFACAYLIPIRFSRGR